MAFKSPELEPEVDFESDITNLIEWDNHADLTLTTNLKIKWDNYWTIESELNDIFIEWTNHWIIACNWGLLSVENNLWILIVDDYGVTIEWLDFQVYREYWELIGWILEVTVDICKDLLSVLSWKQDLWRNCNEVICVTNWLKLRFDLLQNKVFWNDKELNPEKGVFEDFAYKKKLDWEYEIIFKWQIITANKEYIKVKK